MHISGSIKDIRSLIYRAIGMQVRAIYFINPSHVMMIAPTGEYAYFRTQLFISHSALLPVSAIENLYKFLRTAYTQRQQSPLSPYYALPFETIVIREQDIQFDRMQHATYAFDTGFAPIENIEEVSAKVRVISASSLDSKLPYLRLKPNIIKAAYTMLRPSRIESMQQHLHGNCSTFSYHDGQLWLQRADRPDWKRYVRDGASFAETFDDGYVLKRDFAHVKFRLYDADLIAFHRMIRHTQMQHVVLIPFGSFYLAEGHGEELLCKFHMKLQPETTQ